MEIWRDIKDFEGIYQVSNTGKVKRIGDYKNQSASWKAEEKILRAGNNGNGYLFVNLMKNNKRCRQYVHRLVAMAFIPNPDNKKAVNHIDCDRSNNNVENLEWSTYKENNDYVIVTMQQRGTTKKNNKASMPVIQYDLQMNFVKEYPSAREAVRATGNNGIWACLWGKTKTSGNCIWKYKSKV